jgi:hypothetical protein
MIFYYDSTFSKCARFGKKDLINGEITHEYTSLCRNINTKCGPEGKYYEPSQSLFSKNDQRSELDQRNELDQKNDQRSELEQKNELDQKTHKKSSGVFNNGSGLLFTTMLLLGIGLSYVKDTTIY